MHRCKSIVLCIALFFCLSAPVGLFAAQTRNPGADQIKQRVITLAPHITELIFAAGAGGRIVATVDSSTYPAAARSIPRIGDGVSVSVEKVVASRPDLVVAWMPSNATRMLMPALTGLHVPLIYSSPRKMADIPTEIARFGELLDTTQIATQTAEKLTRQIAALRTKYSQRDPVSVFIEVGSLPLYTIGQDPLVNDALRICGGVNVYANLPPAAQVSAESVLMERPDVVITSATGKKGLGRRIDAWSALRLPAALRHHVYFIDPDELFRPGPRMIDATQELCEILDRVRQAV